MRPISPHFRRLRFIGALFSLLGVLSTGLSQGCGSSAPAAICEAQCACLSNCNDTATDICVKRAEDGLDLAINAGCNANSEADNYLSCLSEQATCSDKMYRDDNCGPQKQAFFSCLSAKKCSFQAGTNSVTCIM